MNLFHKFQSIKLGVSGLFIGLILLLLVYLQNKNEEVLLLESITDTFQQEIKKSNTVVVGGKKEIKNNWGASPFGSGTPVIEEEHPKFKKPNTDWPTRQVTLKDGRVLTYVFGEGNPAEVDKTDEQMREFCHNRETGSLLCDTETEFHRRVTRDVELRLVELLNDPHWKILYEKCEAGFRFYDTFSMNGTTGEVPPDRLTYDRLFHGNYLDINTFIRIDPDTGMKYIELNDKLIKLNKYLINSFHTFGSPETVENPDGWCVENNSKEILSKIENLGYEHQPVN